MATYPYFRAALLRGGWLPAPPNRSVLISVADLRDCERLEPLLLSLRRTRLSLLFMPATDSIRKELTERFGETAIITPPWNNRLSSLLFLLTSRVRLLIGMNGIASLPRGLIRQAYLLGIGITVVAPDLAQARGAGGDTASFVDLWLPAEATLAEAMAQFNALMARRPPARSPLQTLIARWLDKDMGRRILAVRARRIATLDELRDALDRPQTILCLGNGPSSEDPALAGHADACLFRVNHRWLARGLYSRPQMVFTGQKRTLFEVRSKPIFAFQTCRAEALLVTHQIFNPLCRFMRFVTLERLGILTGPDWDGVRPTNGATMLATAVALNPPRIVIAGIDLFADPAGAYPGDAQTSNDYVVVHERSIEIDFILKTLKSYGGELIILGKPLAEKWAAAQLAAGTQS